MLCSIQPWVIIRNVMDKLAFDTKLFANLEAVWKKLGHQPTYTEMKQSHSAFGIEVYSERFGSWLRACEAFINFRKGNLQFKKPLKPHTRGLPKQPKHLSQFIEE